MSNQFEDEQYAGSQQDTLARKMFELALALAAEPSKLGQLRQMLMHLQEQREIPEDFLTWACERIDEHVMAMALAYAHDAEVLLQILSFKGGTFAGLIQAIEDLYQHEQITQRVYVKATLLLRTTQASSCLAVKERKKEPVNLGLHGKVGLVTAASKGLGRACAQALAAEGAQVMIAARQQEALLLTARELEESTGSRVCAYPADVGRREDLETLVTKTLETFGGIDILVHNTGGPPMGTFAGVTDEQWQAAFETELLSAVRLIRLSLPSMRQRGGGRIMHIVSTSVKQPSEGLVLANAIRPGIVGLAKTLALDLAPEHITVNTICPGRILTDRLRYGGGVRARMAKGMSEEQALQEMVQAIPLGRAGRPEEVGALVAFLASEQAAYVTGTTLVIDGGLVRSIW